MDNQQTVTGDQNIVSTVSDIRVVSADLRGVGNTILTVGNVGGSFYHGGTHIGDNYYGDAQFFKPRLEGFSPERWVDPPMAHRLMHLLAEHRLLILAGELEDKAHCARHLAYLLRENLEKQGEEAQVRERCQGKDPQRIENALPSKDPAILLLVDVTPPQVVGYTPSKLRTLLRQHQSYAILTTECSPAEWAIEGAGQDAQFWIDLCWESYYGRNLLVDFLERQLAQSDRPLPEGVLEATPEGLLLLGKLPLTAAVEQLKTPLRVQGFAEWLLRSPKPPGLEEVGSQLAQLSGESEAVVHWYRQFESRDQLLVLGLTLFDGLPDDLLFGSLEMLVTTTWRFSDPNLSHFDYRDLRRFSTYFKQIETETGFFHVQCVSRERREQLLKIVWDDQRRRLLATLPALTDLIRSAVIGAEPEPVAQDKEEPRPGEAKDGQAAAERGLRLSNNNTRQIHDALVDSLSLIGLLSLEVVKPYFLNLATDPEENVQKLAARALSAWRDIGQHDKLFTLLRSWWSAASEYEKDDPLLAQISNFHEDPRTSIRAAIALILGYAGRFDRPNRLAPQLLDLLAEMIEDKDPRVQRSLQESIRWLVAWHFRQLEPLLRTKVLAAENLVPAVSFGAAFACSMRPEESFAILDGWKTVAKAERRKSPPFPRERLLAAVALTYGYIRCEDGKDLLGPEAVGARLRAMLLEENHPYVRYYIFRAIEFQALRNFELVALILQDLLSQISLPDRPAAVEVFVRTYLHQRQRLPGGDKRIELDGRSYGMWIDSMRPLTEIEASLYAWIMDSSRPIAQQLAVDVFEAIAETALERKEQELRRVRLPVYVPAAPVGQSPQKEVPKVHDLSLLGRMAVLLAVPRKQKVREVLQPLVAEMLMVQKRSVAPRALVSSDVMRPVSTQSMRERAEALVERWAGVANDSTRAIARYLQRALAFYRWRWPLVTLATAIVVAFCYGALSLYRIVTQPPPPAAEESLAGTTESTDFGTATDFSLESRP